MRILVIAIVATLSVYGQPKFVAPTDPGANLPAQPVGVNDLISVTVYGAPELSRMIRVNAEGAIRLPMLKQAIGVQGLMPLDIETLVSDALAAEEILVDPVVTVTIAELASRPVNVVGAVKHPLTFQASGKTTLLDALARAEGLSSEAGHEILVTYPARESGSVPLTQRIAVLDLVEKANPAANVRLQGGEEVRVPEAGRVFVVGNVSRPGALLMTDPGGLTVLKALAMSEGLTRFSMKQAYIYRSINGGGKQELTVELRKIMERKSPDFALQAGDIFYIPEDHNARVTANVIDKVVSFGAGTASGAIVLSTNR